MRERPNGGYGAHEYRFEDHGLDPAAERARFAGYMAHFDIAPECTAALRRKRQAAAGPARVAVSEPAAR